MKKCLRCGAKMVDDLNYRIDYGRYNSGWIVSQGLFRKNFGEPKCSVCPDCGYIEYYLEDLEALKSYSRDKKENND